MSRHRRAVVIGAGVGGLAVAARLAAAGHDVLVVEQAEQVGGKLGEWAAGGFRFDTGPSLLTMPWTLRDTLRATGADLDGCLELQRLDPIARYRFPDGGWLDADAEDEAFVARLERQIHPGAGVQWSALTARAERMWQAVGEAVLRRPLAGITDLARLSTRLSDLRAVAPHRTMRGLAREYLSDPRLRMMVDRYATYAGSDPRRAPAALLTILHAERRWGGWYVRGGLRRIAEVLEDRIEAAGGRIRTGAQAVAIEVRQGRAAGVRLADGEQLTADVVIANADAEQLLVRLLPTDVGRPLARRLRRVSRSLSGYVLLLGVADGDAGPHPRLAHHTVLFPADYDAEFDGLFGPSPAYLPDPTIYLASPDDPEAAPPGHRAVFVLVNAPRTDQVAGPPAGYADLVLARMAARGVDLRDRVVLRHELTPADLQAATLTPGGAIYGTSSNGPLAAFLRPPNVGPIPGLYLVGGSAHPGGGLPLVLLSAEIVAHQLGARPPAPADRS